MSIEFINFSVCLFQARLQKYAYENHKKHSTRGKIYYEIKHKFCVHTWNEQNMSLLKVKLLDWLQATVTSQKC